MRKLVFLVMILSAFGATRLSAQFSLGPELAYGFDAEKLAIGLRGVYDVNEKWAGTANFLYYLGVESGVTVTEFNLNGNYTFNNSETMRFYALAGFNRFGASTKVAGNKVSDHGTSINLGAGIRLPFGRFNGFTEAKYALGDYDQLMVSAGILFNVGGN